MLMHIRNKFSFVIVINMKKILLILLLLVSGFGWGQCACVSYDCFGNIKCTLFTNCGGGGNSCNTNDNFGRCMLESCNPSCGNLQTSCLWVAPMGSCNISGPSPSNGACWYSGGQCNPYAVCEQVIIILPVDMVSFSVTQEGDENLIIWKTASERNCEYYKLSFSENGTDYSDLIYLAGAGTTSIEQNYIVQHVDPPKKINYYRLVQVDLDGDQKLYGPISIDNRENKRTLIKTINTLGQEVTEGYSGLVINLYDDGTTEKIYK
jgi:hypothetical protein